mmetsp:Transcript_44496/g.117667  ORF Transcript_44496/g.117667 Transcript_44496/m.117667 type:complete len:224 (-) Transcript_44496:27-698(-)
MFPDLVAFRCAVRRSWFVRLLLPPFLPSRSSPRITLVLPPSLPHYRALHNVLQIAQHHIVLVHADPQVLHHQLPVHPYRPPSPGVLPGGSARSSLQGLLAAADARGKASYVDALVPQLALPLLQDLHHHFPHASLRALGPRIFPHLLLQTCDVFLHRCHAACPPRLLLSVPPLQAAQVPREHVMIFRPCSPLLFHSAEQGGDFRSQAGVRHVHDGLSHGNQPT